MTLTNTNTQNLSYSQDRNPNLYSLTPTVLYILYSDMNMCRLWKTYFNKKFSVNMWNQLNISTNTQKVNINKSIEPNVSSQTPTEICDLLVYVWFKYLSKYICRDNTSISEKKPENKRKNRKNTYEATAQGTQLRFHSFIHHSVGDLE